MDAPMTARLKYLIPISFFVLGTCFGGRLADAQGSDAGRVLIQKAQALEARGRPDIAVQVWQQILLSDPNNAMALEGVARDYRLSGNSTASDEALDKLRRINPSDPNIGKIQGLTSNHTRDERLAQAGALAKAGNAEGAMRIYREYYGDHPPDGDIALAYYETLYATPNGKAEALSAMRTLAGRNPGDPRFMVTLGRMLTYDPRTRAEGIKILHEHAQDSDAENSLRQALIWDSANPASANELREYLKSHPKDTELEDRLKANEGKLAEMNAGIARTPEERAAFGALNAHRMDEAQTRFQAMLDKDQKNARAAAGMGFLRMQQSNFGAAIGYLEQAEQNGFHDHSVVEGLATSRFWFTMGEASAAFDANQMDVATQKYKAALGMRPKSPEALNGLAGVYVKTEQFPAAIEVYQEVLKSHATADGYRGLFLAYARNNQNQQALAVMAKFPVAVRNSLSRDPDFLRTLASMYRAQGRDADAQRVLAQALALPFPDNGANLKEGTRLQYAGILMEAKRYDQAAELYKQILNENAGSLPAWMGLVSADHQLTLDRDAIDLVEKMPPATYEAALTDPGFLTMLGSIYQQSNQFEIAQGLLERAARMDAQAGGQAPVSLEIQLASIYLQRNNTAQAYELYRQVLMAHPDNLDAWRGLIGALESTNRNAQALDEIRQIPAAARQQLEADVQFEQSEASAYAATGDTANAVAWFNRVQKHYQQLKEEAPADVEIQQAYLLYNAKNDRALYPELMRLGGRQDLTAAQRQTIQGLWANWSVRRSATAFANGNTTRAVEILDAAAQAFPDNLTVRKAVAGGYLTANRAKEALEIFKTIDMQDATAGDFQGAIGAALAANDKAQAEEWLRQALERFPRDATILTEAARFEQARGDNARAADYYRASLAVMPQVSPTDRLAHELVNPEQEKPNARAATPRDLATLLNPDDEPVANTKGAKLPPLPAYGPDPLDGTAPVRVTSQTGTMASTMPVYPVPTTTSYPPPEAQTEAAAAPTAPAPKRRARPATTNTATTSTATTGRAAAGTTGQASGAATTAVPSHKRRRDNSQAGYSGQMHLPASGQTVNSADSLSMSPSGPVTPAAQTSPVQTAPYPGPQQYSNAPYQAPAQNQTNSNEPGIYLPGQSQTGQGPSGQGQTGQRYQPQSQQPSYAAPAYQPPSQPLNQPSSQPPPQIPPYPEGHGAAPRRPMSGGQTDKTSAQTTGLRLSSQPMNPVAARTQALMLDQTDGQITQGFAIRYLPNATTGAAMKAGYSPQSGQANTAGTLTQAQYTPSAQDAAAGAYSAQKPQTQQTTQTQVLQPVQQPVQPQVQPPALTPTQTRRRRRETQTKTATVPTLVTAPGELPPPQTSVAEVPGQGTQSTTTSGLSDQELQDRNLPPLKGPWVRTNREPKVLSPRDEAELQLRTIEGGYSPWAGGTGNIAHRSGAAGFDGLSSLETVFEASVPLGSAARFTLIARPVFLDSGQADGNAVTTLSTGVVPEPFGTESGTTAATTPPPQQNATGIAGEAQLTFAHLGLAGGYTPYGFLISNFTGRANWRPAGGPFTFSFSRDSVKDTQLSYAGLRDPGSATSFFPGNIWGGVVANQGNVQYARGDLISGFYAAVGGQYLTGHHVLTNKRFDGSAGAYWRAWAAPEYGSLNIGANFFAMHYSYNLQAFTYGMGGYFSPQAYFLANIPLTWTGHYRTRLHYTILGSVGVQAFQQDSEPLAPLDLSIETGTFLGAELPAKTSVGPNYDLRGQMAYAISEHWFVGGFAGANNSRDYTNVNAGFSVRYLFRPQPSTVAGPTGLFQVDDQHDIRPLMVP
jgi:cellulose synthase operon protein C